MKSSFKFQKKHNVINKSSMFRYFVHDYVQEKVVPLHGLTGHTCSGANKKFALRWAGSVAPSSFVRVQRGWTRWALILKQTPFSDASPKPGSELLCSHPRKIREEKKFMEASSSLFTRPPRPFRALRVRVYKEAIKHVLGISSVAFLPVTAPLKCG